MIWRDAASNCDDDIMLKMQRNPGKQKLTDGILRGFWIRKSSHFHPVGQSPGERSSKQRAREDGGRRRIIKSVIHSKQKVRRSCQSGGTEDLNMERDIKPLKMRHYEIMRQREPTEPPSLLHKKKPKLRDTKQLQNNYKQRVSFTFFFVIKYLHTIDVFS